MNEKYAKNSIYTIVSSNAKKAKNAKWHKCKESKECKL